MKIPANQNLLYETMAQAQAAAVGDLEIVCEEETGFIYNKAFDPNLVDYSSGYDNNQSYSQYFESYIDEQIKWLEKYISPKSVIVEVGCGKGYYITKIAKKFPDCKCCGFDTSYAGSSENILPNLKIYKKYFSSAIGIKPDFVICRHTIEHIQHPLEFLKEIENTASENAIVFLETPDVNWILKNDMIYDFFYEHCSYFNTHSLENTLNKAGFSTLECKIEFGGQYMWFVAQKSRNLFSEFSQRRENKIASIKRKLNSFVDLPIFVWGAGAKGATFVNIFDNPQKYVKAVIDINPNKQRKFIGATGHIVIAPFQICEYGGGGIVIVLNENYLNEIKKILQELNLLKKMEVVVL